MCISTKRIIRNHYNTGDYIELNKFVTDLEKMGFIKIPDDEAKKKYLDIVGQIPKFKLIMILTRLWPKNFEVNDVHIIDINNIAIITADTKNIGRLRNTPLAVFFNYQEYRAMISIKECIK